MTEQINLRSSPGDDIHVQNGTISVNKKKLYQLQYDDIIYGSKRNKLFENEGSVFLFLEINGSPNRDRYYVFKVSQNKVDSLLDVISSDIKDIDDDHFLEFGGCDLTEMHPSKDSMYYIPFSFYEIRNGKINYDSAYTKRKSLEVNGVYLANPIDKDGTCCIVISKPKKKKNGR